MSRSAGLSRANGRWDVAVRALAAVPLNYAVTSALTMLLARLLPGSAAQATIGATLLSFLVFAAIAMTAFAVRSVPRLWLGLIATGIAAAAADWCLIAWGGRL
ncbi:hypothetical protein [Sphingopyxis sp. KK2]|uniref:hypothetical protein n=1 Tax=Sphingopyxis sp. KK2 TaxID=1855727 RepID=UPI00097E6730|nr:hypothetical protein [Sphingopyxis sp. KK2]